MQCWHMWLGPHVFGAHLQGSVSGLQPQQPAGQRSGCNLQQTMAVTSNKPPK